jgi:hypothetical protein
MARIELAEDTLGAPELSIRDAYLCMFDFLVAYWERGERSSEDIAILLGGMPLAGDGISADPAMLSDWLASVRAVTGKGPEPL